MAQRSIKSFFTVAPKKKEDGEKTDDGKESLSVTPKKPEPPPKSSEKTKKTPNNKAKKAERSVPPKKAKQEVAKRTEQDNEIKVVSKEEQETEEARKVDAESEDSTSETKSVSDTPIKVNELFSDDSPIKRVKPRGKKRTISDSEDEIEEESPAKKQKKEKVEESPSKKQKKEVAEESPAKKRKKGKSDEVEVKKNGGKGKKKNGSDKKDNQESKVKEKKNGKELEVKEEEEIAKKQEVQEETKAEVKEKKNIAPFFMSKEQKEKEGGEKGGKVDPVTYDPSKTPYHPIKDACWNRGDKVPYLALARTLELVEATSSRLKSIEIVSNFLRSLIVLSPDEVVPALRLCLNQLAPAYTGLELGIGDGALMKAVAQTTGRSVAQIRSDVSTLGDLGLVAEASRGKQKTMFQPPPLTLRGVFDRLLEIANMQGGAAMTRKTDKVQSLLVACKYSEARFLIRSLTGKLRVGLAELSLLQALAQAVVLTPPCQEFPPKIVDASKGKLDSVKPKIEEAAMNIKIAYYQCPSYEKVVSELLSGGLDGIVDRCPITLGLPVKPMLACPSRGVSDVMAKFGSNKFTCEYKYDGERAQIHILADGTVKIFSRNQEDMSGKYPEVVSRAKTWLKPGVTSAILDSEAVAWDLEKKILLPFQVLSTRKRKDVNEADIKVQVCIFAFDLLVLDGESLVDQPLRVRRGLLKEKLQIVEGQLQYATSVDPETPEEVEEFMEMAIKGHCEGLMVKTLDENATYAIARRSQRWLKLKKDYMEGVGDTLDLVVVGGYLGKGRRTGVYGGFLLACFDPESEEYQTICKIGTGFSDEDLQNHSAKLKEHLLERPPSYYRYDQSAPPDHWFSPVMLWEVKCADLSLSPVHKAAIGLVDSDKGISLRFPRFLRVRDDKGPEQSTSASQVASMYLNQDQIKGAAAAKEEEEGFY